MPGQSRLGRLQFQSQGDLGKRRGGIQVEFAFVFQAKVLVRAFHGLILQTIHVCVGGSVVFGAVFRGSCPSRRFASQQVRPIVSIQRFGELADRCHFGSPRSRRELAGRRQKFAQHQHLERQIRMAVVALIRDRRQVFPLRIGHGNDTPCWSMYGLGVTVFDKRPFGLNQQPRIARTVTGRPDRMEISTRFVNELSRDQPSGLLGHAGRTQFQSNFGVGKRQLRHGPLAFHGLKASIETGSEPRFTTGHSLHHVREIIKHAGVDFGQLVAFRAMVDEQVRQSPFVLRRPIPGFFQGLASCGTQ